MNKNNSKPKVNFGSFGEEAPLFDRDKIIVPDQPFGKQRKHKRNNGYQKNLKKIKTSISKGRLRVW